MLRKTPPTIPAPASSPKERLYAEHEFMAWIAEAKEAAYLGADVFERNFTIAGEKMACRVAFYWAGTADQEARIAKLECIPEAFLHNTDAAAPTL